ncbi:hypothetical protein GmHk_11G030893 [Glycine max]|uniref:Uncharacterized protein n=1 Tax=Glycine max TaxID=3847 RepID=A0A0R0HN93_SOYBN|nr:hypothetical protein GmHk_11G030893 [Glycine max]
MKGYAGNVAGEGWMFVRKENSRCCFLTECMQVTEKVRVSFCPTPATILSGYHSHDLKLRHYSIFVACSNHYVMRFHECATI